MTKTIPGRLHQRSARSSRRMLVLGASAILSVLPTPSSAGQSAVMHPHDDYRVRPAGVPVIEVAARPTELPATAQAIVDELRDASLIATIGVEEGSDWQIFGRIDDVAVDEDERIYVVDRTSSNVRVFRTDGSLLAEVGRAGEGQANSTGLGGSSGMRHAADLSSPT
ncbi:MAG: hypothetical protein GKS06_12890 [Acidobacteria bacterium]|nr:hypothetical protein [Acidobacteriota bacterium]